MSVHPLLSNDVLITCGSGGVGKTTTAAALGAGAAMRGRGRVLVLTIDPAKRLATALGLQQVGNSATQVQLPIGAPAGAELWVAMLDTSASWDDLIRRHAPDASTAARILANPLYRNITQRFVQSHDYVATERLHDLVESGAYDFIVVDTPPSRHAIDFLDAPDRMAEFFSSTLLKWITMPYRLGGERAGRLGYLAAKPFYQVADRILGSKFLEDIAEFFLLFQSMYPGFVARAESVKSLLRQPGTAFVVVSTPEPSPIREAEFFVAELAKRHLRLGAAVMNRLAPEAVSGLSSDIQPTGVSVSPDRTQSGSTESKSESKNELKHEADLRRIVAALRESHTEQVELGRYQAQLWRGFGTDAPLRIAVAEANGDITDVQSLIALSSELLGSDAEVRPAPARRSIRRSTRG
jgi:anion-transporting  ArsA/GET3 family ATPase